MASCPHLPRLLAQWWALSGLLARKRQHFADLVLFFFTNSVDSHTLQTGKTQ